MRVERRGFGTTRRTVSRTFFALWAFGCFFGYLLLRHLRRPRAARGVESRRVELRDGRAASGFSERSSELLPTWVMASCTMALLLTLLLLVGAITARSSIPSSLSFCICAGASCVSREEWTPPACQPSSSVSSTSPLADVPPLGVPHVPFDFESVQARLTALQSGVMREILVMQQSGSGSTQ